MPNLDGGHYFLTVLAPVCTDNVVSPFDGQSHTHRHDLAQRLALLPVGRQTAASAPDAPRSPFARNTLNHLARFVIIDGPAFNGRVSGDTLMGQLRKINPLLAQPVDRLTTPFLLFAADVDAPGGGVDTPGGVVDTPGGGGEAALRAYTDTLWATMATELQEIFGHCIGFGTVRDADGFHAYIKRCQIDTTMPFNDYWADGLIASAAPLPLGPVRVAAVVVATVIAVWLAAALLNGLLVPYNLHSRFVVTVERVAAWRILVVPLLLGVLLLFVYGLYRAVLRWGARPFPTAPGSDLPSVLKALFVQQQFTRFASEGQGLDPAALHARFGAFVAAVQPLAAQPTQPPGEVASPRVAWHS